MSDERPWWETAFAADYLDVYAHRDDDLAEAEIAALLPRLREAPGPVLDACCGNGRHLAALRAGGVRAFGFDLSPALLGSAGSRAPCAGRLTRCDMRRPPFAGGWGAVLMLFTAFGYFDDAGNAACLAALGRLLAPGGWLLLDLPEPTHLRRTLVADSSRRTADGLEIVERRHLSGERVEKAVSLRRDGRELRRYTESVRLYSAVDLRDLAAGAGLVFAETWPGLHGQRREEHRLVAWLKPR